MRRQGLPIGTEVSPAHSLKQELGMLIPVGIVTVMSKRPPVDVDGNNDSVGLPVERNCSRFGLQVRNRLSVPIYNFKLGLCVMILGAVQLNSGLFQSVARQPLESGVDVKKQPRAFEAAG